MQDTANLPKRGEANEAPSTPHLSRSLIWIMAIACGLGVANLYYIQPLLVAIAHDFAVTDSAVGIIATLTQLGYALGLLFLVPLGDALNRRDLICGALIVVIIGLAGITFAPSIALLGAAGLIMGVATVVPQIIVPFAAGLAQPQERGRVVGMIMSGLLIGILLARTVSGLISAYFGWRAMYGIATLLMLILVVVLRLTLPQEGAREKISYPRLLRSLWSIASSEPTVREVSIFGALTFAAFQLFWVTATFFLSTHFHFNSGIIGLFGLVGVVGATTATLVGKYADKREPRVITGLMMGFVLLTYLVFGLAGQWLWGIILGVILLDMGSQGAHISNQSRIYALPGSTHSRLNTIYMFSSFVGGTAGTALGTAAWSMAGWPGVCALGTLLMVLALIVYLLRRKRITRADQ